MKEIGFLAAAYFAFWFITLIYLVSMGRRQKDIQQELKKLQGEIAQISR